MSSQHRIEDNRAAKRGNACAVASATACLALLISACGSAPSKPDDSTKSDARTSAPAGKEPTASGARTTALPESESAAAGTTPAPASAPVPKRAQADFDRAVGLMRAGNASEAELEFKQLAIGYPQLAGPEINIGLPCAGSGRC